MEQEIYRQYLKRKTETKAANAQKKLEAGEPCFQWSIRRARASPTSAAG